MRLSLTYWYYRSWYEILQLPAIPCSIWRAIDNRLGFPRHDWNNNSVRFSVSERLSIVSSHYTGWLQADLANSPKITAEILFERFWEPIPSRSYACFVYSHGILRVRGDEPVTARRACSNKLLHTNNKKRSHGWIRNVSVQHTYNVMFD